MMDAVVLPLVLQVLVPLGLIAWIVLGRHASRLQWWLLIGITWSWISVTALVGIWLAVPWYLFLVHAALLGMALLLTWHRYVERPLVPAGVRGRLAVGALTMTLAVCLGLIGWALTGRRAADVSVELAFPLSQGSYLVVNGGRNGLLNPHILTLAHEPRFLPWRGQSYGVDIVRLGPLGLRAAGPLPRDPRAYAGFGEPVTAPCNGTVLRAVDSFPDLPVPQRDRVNLAGNHLILDCNGVWIVLAHLQRGSVQVRPGSAIDAGSPLARLGNSGNTGEPHLHIHAQRPGSDQHPLGGDPLPIRIDGRHPVRNMRW